MDRSLYILYIVLFDKRILAQNKRSFYIFLRNFIYTSRLRLSTTIMVVREFYANLASHVVKKVKV